MSIKHSKENPKEVNKSSDFQHLWALASEIQRLWLLIIYRFSYLFHGNVYASHNYLGKKADPNNKNIKNGRFKSMRAMKIWKNNALINVKNRWVDGWQNTNLYTLDKSITGSPEIVEFLKERCIFLWGKTALLHFFLVFQVQALAHRFEYDRTPYNYNRDFLCKDGSDFSELSHLKDSIYLSKGPLFPNPPKTTI